MGKIGRLVGGKASGGDQSGKKGAIHPARDIMARTPYIYAVLPGLERGTGDSARKAEESADESVTGTGGQSFELDAPRDDATATPVPSIDPGGGDDE